MDCSIRKTVYLKLSRFLPLAHHECNCCKARVKNWQPWGSKSGIYEKTKIIGGGYRECMCPICGSIDRHRWLEYVIENYTDLYTGENRVLHFAPEKSVKEKLRKNNKCWYISGDIEPQKDDHYMDILDIPFRDGFFDYIICNHVVCYIEDEKKCYDELRRCLKDHGILIISFPIRMDVDTYSKYGLSTEESEKEFGTAGNCRIYGKDYKEHLFTMGFEVTHTYRPGDLLSPQDISKYGFLSDDIIIFAKGIRT